MINIDADPELIPLQARGGGVQEFPVFSTPGGTFVSSINGQTGALVNSGGASGFTYSAGAGVITIIGPLTAKGDLYTRTAAVGTRLGAGADGTVLTADAATATGLKWAAPTVTNQPIATKTTAYVLTDADGVILADTTSGSFATTLPSAVGRAGKVFIIKKTVAANTLTIDTAGGNIDGAASIAVTVAMTSYSMVSDGANWWII